MAVRMHTLVGRNHVRMQLLGDAQAQVVLACSPHEFAGLRYMTPTLLHCSRILGRSSPSPLTCKLKRASAIHLL